MNLLDIISLAKAGYKKADIDKLLQFDDASLSIKSEESPEGSPKPTGEESDKTEIKEESETKDIVVDDKPNPEVEELKKQLEETQKKLAEVQKVNLSKDISDKKATDTEKQLQDLVRSFM